VVDHDEQVRIREQSGVGTVVSQNTGVIRKPRNGWNPLVRVVPIGGRAVAVAHEGRS